MKVILIENTSQENIGTLKLNSLPRSGEWIEYDQHTYIIHRIIHGEEGLKLVVIAEG